MTFSATYFGSSGWLVELGKSRVLIDPWLRGTLSFPPGPWLIKGELNTELNVPDDVNLILLTQGLADHAHPQSLEILSKKIPVVGSPSACEVAKSIGFRDVSEIKPGESKEKNRLIIRATSGAKVPNIENGYILSHDSGSLYIEPHGFLDVNIPAQHLDAVITPVLNLKLPLAGNFINGKTILPDLISRFQPLTLLASTTGGDASFSGVLNNLISTEGSLEETYNYLLGKTQFIEPLVGIPYYLKTRENKQS